jgi:hypothetical protein
MHTNWKTEDYMEKDKSHTGKVAGAGVGAAIGYGIGGIGIAAMGTAIGVPVAVVAITTAFFGALVGSIFD